MLTLQSNDLKNKSGSAVSKNRKILVLLTLVIIVFAIYIFRLFSMQIIAGSTYREQSETLSQRTKVIPAKRGEIFDRNATMPIAINTDSFAVDLNPGEIPTNQYDSVAMKLASILKISKKEIDKKIPPEIRRNYQTVEIKSKISFSTICDIAENSIDLPGVSWRSKPLRNYSESKSMSHIVGYVGDITKEELKYLYNKGYTNTSIVGKTGVEKQYDELLQGVAGMESRTVDAKGKLISNIPVIQPPQMGKNLILTIDSDIQKLAEKALGERIGAAVVLKASTGEVLAMASYPYFDSNDFSKDESSSIYADLADDELKPLLNRAVNAAYPPASTFKVIMSAAMLNENAFPSEKKIECKGHIEYGDRSFRCWVGIPGHGYMDLKHALANSCNVYYWTVGRDYLGVDRIASYAKEFGYGSSSEIDLPSQSEGFIPTAQWKERRYHEKWLGGDTLNMSIGQGYTLVTPLQVANMMAMVCNSGKIYKPHVLKQVVDPITNEVIEEVKPEVLFETDYQESSWKQIREALRFTCTDGSAKVVCRNKHVQIAGKTGTAEVSQYKNSWHCWFVGFAPYDAPPEEQIVVAVLVEAINQWEWWSPYAVNIIYQGIFANQTYEEAIDELHFRNVAKPRGRVE